MTTRRPMRYLAVDLGGKRTGLAVGDDLTRIASPVDVLEIPPGPRLVEAILRAIAEHGPDALVIGLPLNMDGSEGEAAKQVRAFGDLLAKAASLPIEFHDERLTSRAAELDLAGLYTRKGKKRRLDAVAAARILSGYLARESG
ncbi:MAG: Holliday junction resolvase RuvX [Phycisphaerales bacterium]